MRIPASLALALALAGPAAPAGAAEFVDGIAAQVGSDIVLASEVQRFAAPVEAQMREEGAPADEIARMRAEILERMIERRLLEQAIRRTEIDATEGEVDQAIEAISRENDITPEDVKASVQAQGLTWEDYRERIRGEIQRQKLLAAMVHSKVRIEDGEVRELYDKRYADQPQGGEEVRLRHVLVPFERGDAETEARACAKAERARARVVAGEPFPEVAREVSAVNPGGGGDVGWVHAGSVAGWMRDTVDTVEAGQMSPVIRTRFGCNVLQVAERRSFEPLTFEDARPQLYQELWNERMAEEYGEFMEELRETTYVERKGVFAEAAPSLTEPVYGAPEPTGPAVGAPDPTLGSPEPGSRALESPEPTLDVPEPDSGAAD